MASKASMDNKLICAWEPPICGFIYLMILIFPCSWKRVSLFLELDFNRVKFKKNLV